MSAPLLATPAPRFPLLRLLAGSVCISFSAVFIKIAQVPPDSAGFYRMLFALLSLGLVLLLRREPLHPGRRATLLLVAAGCCLAFDFMCWHRSIHLVGPGLSTLLGNFQVFCTALFAFLFLRQKPSKLFLLALPTAFVGLFLITGGPWATLDAGLRQGIILGLSTAVLYSGYILLLKQAMDGGSVSGVAAMLLIAVTSTVLLGGITLLGGTSLVIPDTASLWALVGAGVVSTTLGWSLISSAIKQMPATIASLVLLVQPTLSFVWDVLLFQRPAGLQAVVGIALILLAIYLGSYRHR